MFCATTVPDKTTTQNLMNSTTTLSMLTLAAGFACVPLAVCGFAAAWLCGVGACMMLLPFRGRSSLWRRRSTSDNDLFVWGWIPRRQRRAPTAFEVWTMEWSRGSPIRLQWTSFLLCFRFIYPWWETGNDHRSLRVWFNPPFLPAWIGYMWEYVCRRGLEGHLSYS